MSGSRENVLGHEYVIHRRLPGYPLDEVFRSVTPDQMDTILNQIINMLVALHATTWQHIRGLQFAEDGSIVPGLVLEEGAWQVPEILMHFGRRRHSTALISSVLIPAMFHYISAHVIKYIHAINHHISLEWMRDRNSIAFFSLYSATKRKSTMCSSGCHTTTFIFQTS